jgi:hypothetical protein
MQIILKSRVDHARANISIYTMDLTTLNGPNRAGAIDLLKLEKQGLYMQTLQKRVKHAVGTDASTKRLKSEHRSCCVFLFFLIQFKCAHNPGSHTNFAPSDVWNKSLVVLKKMDML